VVQRHWYKEKRIATRTPHDWRSTPHADGVSLAIAAVTIIVSTAYGATCKGLLPKSLVGLFYLWGLVLILISRALSSWKTNMNAKV